MPLSNYSDEVSHFARTNFRGDGKKFGIKQSDRAYHAVIIGKTGTGKTHLLETFIIDDLNKNRGICLFDVHGDLIDFVNKNIPEHRKSDVVYLDIPNPELTFGYNPLKKVSYEKRSLVASGILETFERLNNANAWGPKLSHILRNCLLALLDQPQQTNFSDILRILRDKEFRKVCIRNINNPEVRDFFQKEFLQYNTKFDFIAIYNKIGGFLAHPAIRRLMVENKDNVSLRKAMDESKILLVNLSKGVLGIDTSRLIGSLLLTSLSSAAFSRIDMSENERLPFYLYLDEMQNYANESLTTMFEELRKMRLSVYGAFQHLSQLEPKLRDSLFGNVGTLIVFRISAKDANYIQQELYKDHLPILPGDYVNLPKYHIYLRLMIDGQPSKPFSATTLPHNNIK